MRYFTVFLFSLSLLYSASTITPIPPYVGYDKEKALLGKDLFMGTHLPSNIFMCVTCHQPEHAMTSNKIVRLTFGGIKMDLNPMTLLNAVFDSYYGYEGSTKSLFESVYSAMHNHEEMNISNSEFINILNKTPYYKNKFQTTYEVDKVTPNIAASAITEFIKALGTPNSKFDKYLRGETKLSQDEHEGFISFKKLGCIICHNGVNMGGNSFQKWGAVKPVKYKATVDRFFITKDPADKSVFKVPTLRNIELTSPYFHDGNANTLEDAIDKMAYHNLGLKLTKKEKRTIIAFLKTLTGDLPEILNEK